MEEKNVVGTEARSFPGCLAVRPDVAVLLALIILVPYLLLCVSGALYSIDGAPASVLDSQGTGYLELYIHDQDASAAKWIQLYGGNATVSATDAYGAERLVSQGHIPLYRINDYSFQNNTTDTQFIYLYYANVVQQKYIVGNNLLSLGNRLCRVLKQKQSISTPGLHRYILGSRA